MTVLSQQSLSQQFNARQLLGSPSRWAAWGGVAMVHVALGLLLLNGLSIRQWVLPTAPVKVVMLEDDKPAPPEAPKPVMPELSPVEQLYVPPPEVEVVRSTPAPIMATVLPPPVNAAITVVNQTPAEKAGAEPALVSISEADYLVKPKVNYPVAARRAGEQGTVVLAVWVDIKGAVERIAVHASSGYIRLDEAAMRAVRMLKVRPYERNGVPMPVQIRIPVEFFPGRAV